MSLTIYEVLCNARYNLENAVFPFQIEMAKEQLANALDAIDNGKTLNDVWEEAQPNAAVPYKPTLTPQNEPLTLGFDVVDKKTGKYPDWERIAREEDWAKGLVYCDMDGVAIREDGSLILLDECGNCVSCPPDRFEIRRAPEGEAK